MSAPTFIYGSSDTWCRMSGSRLCMGFLYHCLYILCHARSVKDSSWFGLCVVHSLVCEMKLLHNPFPETLRYDDFFLPSWQCHSVRWCCCALASSSVLSRLHLFVSQPFVCFPHTSCSTLSASFAEQPGNNGPRPTQSNTEHSDTHSHSQCSSKCSHKYSTIMVFM